MVSHGFRVSASVILSLRSLLIPLNSSNVTSKSRNRTVSRPDCNLNVLTLRRGQNDKMLPGADVFPGGNVEPSDFNTEWLELYSANGFNEDSFARLKYTSGICPGHPAVKDGLPSWLGFRLSAIRETFEECGILLCRPPGGSGVGSPWTSYTVIQDVEDWQRRVSTDPHQMLVLCRTKECVPDVWGLHTWSNWLTPPHFQMRHNTMFFLAVLYSEPPQYLDLREMDKSMWRKPYAILDGAAEGAVFLMNPQIYEISRLARFQTAEKLAEFAINRSVYGCSPWMPVTHSAQDGLMFLLPGDSEYPDIASNENKQIVKLDCTIDEAIEKICRQQGTVHRCVKHEGAYGVEIVVHNFTPPHNHVLPVSKQIFVS